MTHQFYFLLKKKHLKLRRGSCIQLDILKKCESELITEEKWKQQRR